MPPELKHCRTCTCGEAALVLPMNYFPEGFSIEYISGEVLVVDRQGNHNYYWTNKFNKDTEGYTSVIFEGEQ